MLRASQGLKRRVGLFLSRPLSDNRRQTHKCDFPFSNSEGSPVEEAACASIVKPRRVAASTEGSRVSGGPPAESEVPE